MGRQCQCNTKSFPFLSPILRIIKMQCPNNVSANLMQPNISITLFCSLETYPNRFWFWFWHLLIISASSVRRFPIIDDPSCVQKCDPVKVGVEQVDEKAAGRGPEEEEEGDPHEDGQRLQPALDRDVDRSKFDSEKL